jgi:Carboxypeptidase regulatory-like domain
MFLLLHSSDGDDDMTGALAQGDGFSPVAHVGADGSFEWKNVLPGNYSVQISEASTMPDSFLKSVTAGGHDGLESGFSINGGTVALDLLASGNGAVAEGVVTGAKDEAVADVMVVAVPGVRFRNHPALYRKAVTDQSGRFRLRGLPPGDYTLYAFESLEGDEFYNPEFLKLYEGQGKTLRLSEGERKSLQIKAIPGEDQP